MGTKVSQTSAQICADSQPVNKTTKLAIENEDEKHPRNRVLEHNISHSKQESPIKLLKMNN